jgi:hypothetical protein
MSIKKILAIAGMVALTSSACVDLEVTNLNAPDRERALATPGDVEALIAGSYRTWWFAQHNWHGLGVSTMADAHTSSWGNFGMRELSSEPRIAIPNSPSWGYAYVLEDPYFDAYSALAAVRDGIIAIEGGLEIGQDGEDTQRALTFAKFIQGISLGLVALMFDQGAILDESTDIETVSFSPYAEVMAAAIDKLNEVIQLANANSFTTPDNWMSGEHTNTEIAQLAHSYIARFMAGVARTPAERAAVDWSSVRSHVDQGITEDFTVYSDDINWWDVMKAYGVYTVWGRVDVRTVGPADQSGAFQTWMTTPVAQRDEILIDTDDRRITDGDPEGTGKYFGYFGAARFRPERGTYHMSYYGTVKYDDLAYDWLGDMVEIPMAEMNLLKAEALYRLGDRQGAADIVNMSRVANGELPPVTVDGTSGDRCTPRTASGACGDLFEALKYEKRLEVFLAYTGDAFFDDRGWGDLVSGTAMQFPVPAAELETLIMEIYTFGGGGEGSAPSTGMDLLKPNFSSEVLSQKLAAIGGRAPRCTDGREGPAPA